MLHRVKLKGGVPPPSKEPREEIVSHGGSFHYKSNRSRRLLLLDPERGIINGGNLSHSDSVYSAEEFKASRQPDLTGFAKPVRS